MKKITLLITMLVLIISSSVKANGNYNKTNKPVTKFTMPDGLNESDYLPKTIIFRVKPEFRNFCHITNLELPMVNGMLNSFGIVTLKKVFPNNLPPATEKNEAGFAYADLSLIYEYTYSADIALVKAINSLLSSGQLLYAEPKYLPKVFYTPNDPSVALQYFLGKIQAYNAWNITKGDTTIVIGITDTGTDTNHPDLAPNIKHNYADPINSIDDDGDTYVDNFTGWDLGENDNDPAVGNCGTCAHGSHVSGCAAAVTDNGIGVASPGFYSKFLPVKIADANGALTKAYEGTTYAADHGCQIINCSWGGGGGGQFGQNVITYASINKNALVVVAAGNNSNEQAFYPANYQHAFSIASTDDVDRKSGFSNYGYGIDVCSPGTNIFSTVYNNTYTYESGTSMASPIAAGAAAIVKSFYPSYSGLQVGEQLRITADNVDNAPGNGSYAGKLGTGRINLYRALTESGPSVHMENLVFSDNNDNVFIANDTLDIVGDIINYLAPTTNLVATISSTSSYITIIDNSTTAGAIATLGTYNNLTDPFKVKIKTTAPLNASIKMRIDFTDGAYSSFQYFTITVNVDYINVTLNDVSTTVTSKGRIGYNSIAQADGLGFEYQSNPLMYEGGLMIGNSSNAASDMVRGDPQGSTDADFLAAQVVHHIVPTIKSEDDITGIFNDNLANSPLPVLVNHNFYVWSTPGNRKYVIFEYLIKNNGTAPLSSLYAGIYADFDIGNSAENLANTDLNTKMGYCFNTATGGLYAGIKVLTPGPFLHFATDNDGGNGGISNYDGFTTSEKYQTLSTNHATAGGTGTGADVSNIVSSGPYSLNPNDVVTIAFALIAGDDLNDLITSANNAQIKYDGLTALNENLPKKETFSFVSIYPNPANNSASLAFLVSQPETITIKIVDALGSVIYVDNNYFLNAGGNLISLNTKSFESGIYSCNVSLNGRIYSKKFTIAH